MRRHAAAAAAAAELADPIQVFQAKVSKAAGVEVFIIHSAAGQSRGEVSKGSSSNIWTGLT